MDRLKVIRAIKELRWLHFNFPYQGEPKNDADKLCNLIHLYTGDAIAVLMQIAPEQITGSEYEICHKTTKPCPFCGGKAEIIHFPKTAIYAVGCTEDILCPGYVYKAAPTYYGRDTALKAWNTRN